MAFWVLFWFGWNCLFDARGIVLIEAWIALAIYDKISSETHLLPSVPNALFTTVLLPSTRPARAALLALRFRSCRR
ncbi:hypothetical protein ACPOL_3457 [Acidisarcina polymorpha]|uniref:Uncharacterized protein n=1 Tax=Acidisarcina polymorpha TaxID=2211140 RepID=A0A2Z5G0V8_9BACT|nr:hypothetical protein ACPOL_3457 [Acidisarcina polymorpha]